MKCRTKNVEGLASPRELLGDSDVWDTVPFCQLIHPASSSQKRDLLGIKSNRRVVTLVSVVISITQPVPSPSYPSGRELSPPGVEVYVKFAYVGTRKVHFTTQIVARVHLLDVIQVFSHIRRIGFIGLGLTSTARMQTSDDSST